MSISIARFIGKSLFFSLLFTVVFSIAGAGYIFKFSKDYENVVYPNVYINDTDHSQYTKQEILEEFKPINSELAGAQITFIYEDTIATFSGERIKLAFDADKIAEDALKVGKSSSTPPEILQKLVLLTNISEFRLFARPTFDLTDIKEYIEETKEDYSTEPENALFEMKDGKVVAFQDSKPGITIDDSKAIQELEKTIATITEDIQDDMILKNNQYTINLQQIVSEPEISLSDANNLGIVEKIGEGTSDYSHSSAERSHNVELAATKFHGVLIPPGEIFSYNKTVGEISRRTGYSSSYVIQGGQTVLGDGGGVCQDSTTLFRAALNTGLPIVERKAHSYRVGYYENDRKPGFDATVYSPVTDFKFKNDTGNYILIQMRNNPAKKTLAFEFWGQNDGRKVELSDATLYDIRPAPPTRYEETPTLPAGTTKQVEWPAIGTTSKFTYKVTSKDGEVLQDETFISKYRPWAGVILVGTN